MTIKSFQKIVWNYYQAHGRSFAWRKTNDPYKIFISEIMLQQTQVGRVEEKYPIFLKAFPDFSALARAPLARIMKVWHGMGYNRRALYLKKSAKIITQDFHGILPCDPLLLENLPGLGKATAASVAVFAFNKPTVFIETNIRRVFIHHFGAAIMRNLRRSKKSKTATLQKISDKDIFPIVERALDRNNPREWYWALMDYGTFLAKQFPNPNRKSTHYSKQSVFKGSRRQLRGAILGVLLKQQSISVSVLTSRLHKRKKDIKSALDIMMREGMVVQHKHNRTYRVS